MVAWLLDKQHIRSNATILEPCAGNGNIAKAVRYSPDIKVITNDIDLKYNCDYNLDATLMDLWIATNPVDWVVTNPPYKAEVLEQIMWNSLQRAQRGVAMILRLTANEPVIRRGYRGDLLMMFADNLRYLITFSAPRPSYTGNGKTVSVTTAWFVWDKNFSWKELGVQSPFQYVVNWR